MPAPAFPTMLKLLCEGDVPDILDRAAERAERVGTGGLSNAAASHDVHRARLLKHLAEQARLFDSNC